MPTNTSRSSTPCRGENGLISIAEGLLEPRTNRFIPHSPTTRQAAFLMLECLEAFYGGAGGGGENQGPLMGGPPDCGGPRFKPPLLPRTNPPPTMPHPPMYRPPAPRRGRHQAPLEGCKQARRV